MSFLIIAGFCLADPSLRWTLFATIVKFARLPRYSMQNLDRLRAFMQIGPKMQLSRSRFGRLWPIALASSVRFVTKGCCQAITDLDYCNAHASGLTSSRALARGRLPTLSIGDFCHGGWFRCRSRCVLRSKVAGPHQAITQQHAPLCVWTARTANASLAQASVPTLSRHVWDTVSSWHPSGLRERRAVASCYSRRVLC